LFKIKQRYRNVLDTMFELFPRMARYRNNNPCQLISHRWRIFSLS